MAVHVSFEVFCDICYNWESGDTDKGKAVARKNVKRQGWQYITYQGKRADLCPKCHKRIREEESPTTPT